jgi:hypothetical protein
MWEQARAFERLTQLLYDARDVQERYRTECLRMATDVPAAGREEWHAQAAADATVDEMVERVGVMLNYRCKTEDAHEKPA